MKLIIIILLFLVMTLGLNAQGYMGYTQSSLLTKNNTWTGTQNYEGAVTFESTVTFSGSLGGTSLQVPDDFWIGLGNAAGRIIFDSTPTPDDISLVAANVGIGTASPSALLDVEGSGLAFEARNTTDAASVQVGAFYSGDRTSPLDNDEGYFSFYAEKIGGTSEEVARMAWVNRDVSSTNGRLYFDLQGGAALRSMLDFGFSTAQDIGDFLINDDGVDIDFRIESDTDANAFFLEGSSGNVGIGTTSPDDKLHISGASDVSLQTMFDTYSTNTARNSVLNLRHSNSNTVGTKTETGNNTVLGTVSFKGVNNASNWYTMAYIDAKQTTAGGAAPDGYLRLYATDDILLMPDGNVGIGTTSPSAALDIVDTDGLMYLSTSEADNTNKFGRYATQHYDVDEEPFIMVQSRCDSDENRVNIGGGSSSGNAATLIDFWTAANHTTTQGTQRMIINSDGNVGIGTNAPSDFYEGADNLVVGAGSGDVGITVYSGSNATDYGGLFFADGTGGDAPYRGVIAYDQGNDDLIFSVAGAGYATPNMTLDATGLGIGTTSPSSMLHIDDQSPSADQSMFLINTNAGSRFSVDEDGDVVVGGNLTQQNSAPIRNMRNTTHEDAEHGRESVMFFTGEQSGGEASYLGYIRIDHEGSSDDEKGKMRFAVNDGDDGYTLADKMVLLSNGNVGIGDASPDYPLEVNAGSDQIGVSVSDVPKLVLDADGSTSEIYAAGGNDLRLARNAGANHLYINSSGNVGIGTATPTEPLTLSSTTTPQMSIIHTTGADSATFSVDANGDLTIAPSGGDVFFGSNRFGRDSNDYWEWSSNDNVRLLVGGATMANFNEAATDSISFTADKLHYNQLDGGAVNLTADANGNIIREPSDIRFKTNIKSIDNALEKVMQLEGRSYDWNESRFGNSDYGLVAQEVKAVDENFAVQGEYMSIKQNAIIAVLVEAIKEQQKQIDELKRKLQ